MNRIFVGSTSTLAVFILFLTTTNSWGEPWMANRFAENCASCHSPGRRDVANRDRRCTLTCQACHTNPNGGGLRNHHGMWTQQRWLRSTKGPKALQPKGVPAPTRFQKYAKMPATLSENNKEYSEMAKDGPKLAVLADVKYKEENYKRDSDGQYKIVAQNPTEFMARVTDVDPLRTEYKSPWSVGADFKYVLANGDKDFSGPSNLADESIDYKAPIFFDLGARYRPVQKHVQLVFEQRFYNTPPGYLKTEADRKKSKSDPLWAFDGGSINRSAYVLFDDLPYNTHFMYGNFQPMFGYSTGDYSTLLSSITTSQEDVNTDEFSDIKLYKATDVYRSASFGVAAGAPFFNFHWIKPRKNPSPGNQLSPESANADGFAANAGFNFTQLGANIMVSYWSTKSSPTGAAAKLKRDMMSISAGMQIKNWIINVDSTEVEREQTEKHKGQVQTIDAKYRFYRENYVLASWASANTSRNLKNGEATEMMLGVKSYLNPGMKLEFMYIVRDDRNKDTADELKTDIMQLQAHVMF